MTITPALVIAWLEYLTRALHAHLDLAGLKALIDWAQSSLRELEQEGLVNKEHASYDHLLTALGQADRRLAMLQRVATFNGNPNPRACTHVHQRRGTGIFYNSVEALQCMQCEGWQSIRSVIQ